MSTILLDSKETIPKESLSDSVFDDMEEQVTLHAGMHHHPPNPQPALIYMLCHDTDYDAENTHDYLKATHAESK